MTKLITTTNSPLGALRGFSQLPALFNEHWLQDALSSFDKWDKAFDFQNAHYPYDISYIKDEQGQPHTYRLDVALAGIGKDNIKLSVKDRQLTIEIDKPAKSTTEADAVWLRNGISHRSSKLEFSLGKDVDIKKINSGYKDGLLRVTIPVIKSEVTDITINVD